MNNKLGSAPSSTYVHLLSEMLALKLRCAARTLDKTHMVSSLKRSLREVKLNRGTKW